MFLDDTKDRVYIHDLESEIAAIEAAEEHCPKGFWKAIDKKISAIPSHLLRDDSSNVSGGDGGLNTQMVLYHVPASLSVPEEQDHVRKAILAARARAKEKQEQEREAEERHPLNGVHALSGESHVGLEHGYGDDYDAMDLG